MVPTLKRRWPTDAGAEYGGLLDRSRSAQMADQVQAFVAALDAELKQPVPSLKKAVALRFDDGASR